MIFRLTDIDWVLRDWQICIFETENEAKEAGEKRIKIHKQQLLE